MYSVLSTVAKSLFIALLILGITGCLKASSGNADDFTGGTPLTGAQIAGTHISPCTPVTDNSYGTSVTAGAYSFYKQIVLTSSYTYGMSVMLFNSSNCVGGSQVFSYSQAGIYSIGASLLPGGATGIYYTATASYLTVYGGTSGGGSSTFGNGWVTAFNNGCPGGPTFTSGSASVQSVANLTCNTNGLNLPQFPAAMTAFYDAVSLDSATSPTVFKVYPAVNLFIMGQYSSFPLTTSVSYTF